MDAKERLARLLSESSFTQNEIASAVGVSKQAVSKWFLAQAFPRTDSVLVKVADKLETTPEFLKFGITTDSPASHPLDEDGYVMIPHIEVYASCGNGVEVCANEPMIKMVKVSMDWLSMKCPSSSFRHLQIIDAEGDSMNPTICHGDMILVDTSDTQIRTDALYVLKRGCDIYSKRVQRTPFGIRLISDNPIYPPIDIPFDELERDFAVLGRIRAVGSFKSC